METGLLFTLVVYNDGISHVICTASVIYYSSRQEEPSPTPSENTSDSLQVSLCTHTLLYSKTKDPNREATVSNRLGSDLSLLQ